MGFLSRLFGVSDDGGKKQSSETPNVMLRTVRSGGYDKADVLAALDMLGNEIFALEEAVKARGEGKNYTLPPETEIPEMKTAKMGGFNEEDVKEYIDALNAKISSLRAQL